MRLALLSISFVAVAVSAMAGWQLGAFGDSGKRQKIEPFSSAFEHNEAFQFEPPQPGSYALNVIKQAPEGTVLDIHGTSNKLSDLLQDKLSLVSFVYLNCGDINGCPLAMSTLFEIHDTSAKIPGLHENVQLMTISFDPERDTVDAIEAFAYPITQGDTATRKLDWHVLTTSGQAALKPILEGFGQVVDRSTDQDQISHLLRIYLVDREGQIRNIYGLGLIDPRLLMGDVETLLLEEGLL